MQVFGSDDEKIGEVYETLLGWFVVTAGFVFPKDHYVPLDAVDRIGADGAVSLRYMKGDALGQGWETDPADIEPDAKARDPFSG